MKSPLDKTNASHAKAFNRLLAHTQKIEKMNLDRKYLISQFNKFIKKLLNEKRITKDEIASYMKKRSEL